MKTRRFLAVTVGVLGLVLVTVGLVGLAQAEKTSTTRFKVLPPDQLGNVWVLDKTTSLEWQKTAGSVHAPWSFAITHCTGLQGGSRLPEVKELISLVDYSKFNPALPEGHPFTNVQLFGAAYYSATSDAANSSNAWVVDFNSGHVYSNNKENTGGFHAWCVR